MLGSCKMSYTVVLGFVAAALHLCHAQVGLPQILDQVSNAQLPQVPDTSPQLQRTSQFIPQPQQQQQTPQQQPPRQLQQQQGFAPQGVVYQQGPPYGSPQNDVIYRCRQSSFATDADVLTILQSQGIPYTTTGQCLLACSAQRLGLVTAGYQLDIQGAGVLMRTLYPARGNDYIFQNELMNAVNSCPSSFSYNNANNQAAQLAGGIQLAQAGLDTLSSFTQGRRR